MHDVAPTSLNRRNPRLPGTRAYRPSISSSTVVPNSPAGREPVPDGIFGNDTARTAPRWSFQERQATENTATVQALLDNLIERGLDPEGCYLFIVDGAKALTKAIRRTFGADIPIQRCQIHKARNIT